MQSAGCDRGRLDRGSSSSIQPSTVLQATRACCCLASASSSRVSIPASQRPEGCIARTLAQEQCQLCGACSISFDTAAAGHSIQSFIPCAIDRDRRYDHWITASKHNKLAQQTTVPVKAPELIRVRLSVHPVLRLRSNSPCVRRPPVRLVIVRLSVPVHPTITDCEEEEALGLCQDSSNKAGTAALVEAVRPRKTLTA